MASGDASTIACMRSSPTDASHSCEGFPDGVGTGSMDVREKRACEHFLTFGVRFD